MNYAFIHEKILDIYTNCSVHSFPLDCIRIINSQGIRVFTYQELYHKDPDLYQIGLQYSTDAFRYRDLICYNTDMPTGRIRFSLMHELGHYILGHSEQHTVRTEQEANYFSSHILAPRLIMYYAKCEDIAAVSDLFDLTKECAEIAFNDYQMWRQSFLSDGLKDRDRQLYRHFYLSEVHKIVYKKSCCNLCGTALYNTEAGLCPACTASLHISEAPAISDDFERAEQDWLDCSHRPVHSASRHRACKRSVPEHTALAEGDF